jgi:hypothetical protein
VAAEQPGEGYVLSNGARPGSGVDGSAFALGFEPLIRVLRTHLLPMGEGLNEEGGRFSAPAPSYQPGVVESQLHPVVLPHVSHFRHVPFLTIVKFEHSGQASPT